MTYSDYGLINTDTMLKNALSHNYAVPAFNVYNMETISAIVMAANHTHSPLIISISESALNYMGDNMLMGMICGLKLNPSQKIALHLDHGSSFEICARAIKLGFSSIMIDASKLPLSQNIDLTNRVIEIAHKHNVSVEAEVGILFGTEDENTTSTDSEFTSPDIAEQFVRATNVDSLAIAIGTSHGVYKNHTDNGKLRFDILTQIQNRIPNTPLVLHGASNVPEHLVETINKFGGNITTSRGIDANQLRIAATQTHICKINMDTDLRLSFTAGVRKSITQNPSGFNPREYLGAGRDMICNNCLYVIREITKSENKI